MRLLITCEHASGALPPGADLAVGPEVLDSHVSFDRGAAVVARALAARTGAPLHLGAYSRLWVDLNRRASNPAVILDESYGVPVPGNRVLTEAARRARLEAAHRPYRRAALRDARSLAATAPVLHLSIHSFEASLDPEARAFDVGVLFDEARSPEREVAERLRRGLVARGYDARANAPYRGVPEGLTSWLREHLPPARYCGLELEASQGRLDTPERLARYAAHLAEVLRELGAQPPTVTV